MLWIFLDCSQQRLRRAGRLASSLLPVLQCAHSDAQEFRKFVLTQSGLAFSIGEYDASSAKFQDGSANCQLEFRTERLPPKSVLRGAGRQRRASSVAEERESICRLEQRESLAAWQAIARKIRDIDCQDRGHTRFGGQPIQGSMSEIHFALAALAVSTHPSNNVAKMFALKRINHNAAQLYPFEHLKTLRNFEQIRRFDYAGPVTTRRSLVRKIERMLDLAFLVH